MFEVTVASSVLIVVIILLRHLLKGKIDLRLQYAWWLLVAIRLLMPFPLFQSPASIFNVLDVGKPVSYVVNPMHQAQPDIPDGMNHLGQPGSFDPAVDRDLAGNAALDKPVASDPVADRGAVNRVLRTVWLLGVGAVGVWFVAQNVWFCTRLRKTRQKANIPESRLPVYLSTRVKTPCLFGLRPAIYIPHDSLDDGIARKYVLAHEETHYKHGDQFWVFVRCLCLILHWFNPLVWWAAVLSRRDCEMACDESVLNRIGDEHRKAYGNTLISMIERQARPSELLLGATTMTGRKSAIRERIEMIVKKPRMLPSTVLVVVFILAIAAGCTFTAKSRGGTIEYPSPSGGGEWATTFAGFSSGKEGWFVGSSGVALGTSNNYVYLTHDGGKTWAETGNVNDQWPRVLTSAAFADSHTGYLCFRYDIENLGPVYLTTDGGQSWNRLTIPELTALAGDGVGEVRSMGFDENGQGALEFYFRIEGADEGAIQRFVSVDRGQTWLPNGESENPPSGAARLFAESTGNISDYMPHLLSGKTVSDYNLLPCLENFTHSTWLELEQAYNDPTQANGRFWFNELWTALHDAAISKDGTDQGDQLLRDYYIGKAYLSGDGAYSEGLADIVMEQWEDNSLLYSACLNEFFLPEESVLLRQCITFSMMYWRDDPFGLYGPSLQGGLYLGSYPVDFPFGHSITEKSRDTFRAESFGRITVVECDGLQATYVNNGEDVYTTIALRANKERYQALGVTIGDTEEFLLAHWPQNLKKVGRISYDDEAWFGDGYDHAYAYTPENSTKSVVFIVTDGSVSGIEIVNGLDGPLY